MQGRGSVPVSPSPTEAGAHASHHLYPCQRGTDSLPGISSGHQLQDTFPKS